MLCVRVAEKYKGDINIMSYSYMKLTLLKLLRSYQYYKRRKQ